ncbi:MAG: hypothetical protein AB4352_10195 [Hormoscilla sp.]
MHSTAIIGYAIALFPALTISLAAVSQSGAIARPQEYSTRSVTGIEIKSEDKKETCPTCITEDGQYCCPH